MHPTAALLLAWFFALPLSPTLAAELWYERPAAQENELLPIGSGCFTAWVDGGTGTCRLQLQARSAPQPGPPAGHGTEASAPAPSLAGDGGDPAKALELDLDWLDAELPATRYRRSLDLATGVAVTKFQRGGAGITLTTFCSAVDDLLVVHLRANKPGALNFRVRLGRPGSQPGTRPGREADWAEVEDRRVLVMGRVTDGVPILPSARAWVFPMESEVTPGKQEITVRGEGEALILCAIAADTGGDSPAPSVIPADRLRPLGFGGDEPPDLSLVWSSLLERHQTQHRREMERSTLTLEGAAKSASPTDARLQALQQGAADPALMATLFECGRYQRLWGIVPPARAAAGTASGSDPQLATEFLQAVGKGVTEDIGGRLRAWLAKAAGPNLFDCASPDGTAIVAEGIAGMLIQRQKEGGIVLLPCLPKDWPSGKATGLAVAGDYQADVVWKEGRVVDYQLTRTSGRSAEKVTVVVNGEVKEVEAAGEP